MFFAVQCIEPAGWPKMKTISTQFWDISRQSKQSQLCKAEHSASASVHTLKKSTYETGKISERKYQLRRWYKEKSWGLFLSHHNNVQLHWCWGARSECIDGGVGKMGRFMYRMEGHSSQYLTYSDLLFLWKWWFHNPLKHLGMKTFTWF